MKEISDLIAAIRPTLEQLEHDRALYLSRRRNYLLILFLPLIALVALGLLTEVRIFGFIAAGLWLIIGLALYYFRAAKIGAAYQAKYKMTVVPALLSTIDPQLEYHPQSGIPSSTFMATELFTTSPDRYSTEDLIQGNYGKTFLQLAEIDAEERRTRTDSDGKTETYYVTIFDGLLLIADFHKHFHGRTFIFPDNAERLFGNFGRFFQKMGGRRQTDLIRLEDPEFEKRYAVYATDEIEARYILSTAMMRRILEMGNRFGNDIRIGFKDSSLLLAVPHSQPFLEPKKGLPATDIDQIGGMLHELKYFLDTIEELDLNTRIWTKE